MRTQVHTSLSNIGYNIIIRCVQTTNRPLGLSLVNCQRNDNTTPGPASSSAAAANCDDDDE